MNAVLNFKKPHGITSHKAVASVKKALGVKKAGHAGTLDPIATGVLLVCLNEATKISRFLCDMEKQYVARIKLGQRTDTFDSDGNIVDEKDASHVSEKDVHRVVGTFLGKITQKVPTYSAVRVGGERLYKLARRGADIERPERQVEVYGIKVLDISLPWFDISVECSKGTYIRTLCDDIGVSLGTLAHMVSLERTAIGPFNVDASLGIDTLESKEFSVENDALWPLDRALSELKEIRLDSARYEMAKNGVRIHFENGHEFREKEFIRLKNPEGLLFGIGSIRDNVIRIERILHL